jgi:hypothetical protein
MVYEAGKVEFGRKFQFGCNFFDTFTGIIEQPCRPDYQFPDQILFGGNMKYTVEYAGEIGI